MPKSKGDGTRGKSATGSAASPDIGISKLYPESHFLRPRLEAYGSLLSPLLQFGDAFARRIIEDAFVTDEKELADDNADDLQCLSLMYEIDALGRAIGEKKQPNRAELAAANVLGKMAEAAGYVAPKFRFFKTSLSLSGDPMLDAYAKLLGKWTEFMGPGWIREERSEQTDVDPAVLDKRTDFISAMSVRFDRPIPVRTFILFFDITEWTKEAAMPFRIMFRHYAGLDIPPSATPEIAAQCKARHDAMKRQGLLDIPGEPEYVPPPVPRNPEQEADPLWGLDDKRALLSDLGNTFLQWREREGDDLSLVNFEIPHSIPHEDLMIFARRGLVRALHEHVGELSEEGVTVSFDEPASSVSWHLTDRGVAAVSAAVGSPAPRP